MAGRHRLKVTQLSTKVPGIISDGDGLYLRSTASKSGALNRSWVFIFHLDGKRRELGLGAFGSGTSPITLARAREKAEEIRALLASGVDPLHEKRRAKGKPTFGKVADEFFEAKKPGWSNANHVRQWERTLTEVCKPLRSKLIDQVNTEDVLAILRPIWLTTPEAGRRVRVRIESVLDFAKSKELRAGDNPARGKGHILELLAKHSDTKKHLPALPYSDLPAFWKRLEEITGSGASALRFAILTAARPGEARMAPWAEVDLEKKVWVVPADRMKERREHRVPLSEQAVAMLTSIRPKKPNPSSPIFPGQGTGKAISDMTLTAVLRRLRVPVTVHGFRSTFRDWVAEETDVDGMVAEAALAHLVGDATEQAYRRGDAFNKRRILMQTWANYCTGVTL